MCTLGSFLNENPILWAFDNFEGQKLEWKVDSWWTPVDPNNTCAFWGASYIKSDTLSLKTSKWDFKFWSTFCQGFKVNFCKSATFPKCSEFLVSLIRITRKMQKLIEKRARSISFQIIVFLPNVKCFLGDSDL